MTHLVTLIDELLRRQIRFRSLCDGALDTTTASGELVFHIFSALAQFERRLSQERTQAGLTAARARGRHGGRRPITADDPRVRMATAMVYGAQPDLCGNLAHVGNLAGHVLSLCDLRQTGGSRPRVTGQETAQPA
jgi:hypothetical protein